MKNENKKNLSELLAQFFDADQASKVAADIVEGEQIFTANPAPTPSPSLLADIKRRMAATNAKHRRARHFTRRIAAAAVVLLVLGTGITLLQRTSPQMSGESFWQGTPENTIDAQLTQLEQAESDAPMITLEVNGSDMPPVSDLTDELNDIERTFWEG
jgi:hypothetical protein